MEREKADHAIATMCRVLGVSTSGYHAWRQRPPSRRSRADAALSEKIGEIQVSSRWAYGSPRIGWAMGPRPTMQLVIEALERASTIRAGGIRRWITSRRPSTSGGGAIPRRTIRRARSSGLSGAGLAYELMVASMSSSCRTAALSASDR